MPTQSDSTIQGSARRSVFGNYARTVESDASDAVQTAACASPPEQTESAAELSANAENALARAFVYRYLARAYEYPDLQGWAWLSDASIQSMLRSSIRAIAAAEPAVCASVEALAAAFQSDQYETFVQQYVDCFGHAARGSCPLNEIEYGDLKADPLFQPHRLADLVAFYRAFGLEVADDANERQDHICMELEFMSVLAAKEANAIEHGQESETTEACRDAQRMFLREHLGRWTIAFARRLSRATGGGPLGAVAEFTRSFVDAECRCFGVTPGSDQLSLRPVNPVAETMCGSCGKGEPIADGC